MKETMRFEKAGLEKGTLLTQDDNVIYEYKEVLARNVNVGDIVMDKHWSKYDNWNDPKIWVTIIEKKDISIDDDKSVFLFVFKKHDGSKGHFRCWFDYCFRRKIV